MAINLHLFRERARLNLLIRTFFNELSYMEVETPLLVPGVIPERSIELFRTQQILPGGKKRDLYLVPSPEISMKRLLAEGSGNIFQIGRSFRNSEQSGNWHHLEFTMLEWYGVDIDEKDNIKLTTEFLQFLGNHFPAPILHQKPLELTMDEAFLRWTGASLKDNIHREQLYSLAERQGLSPEPTDDEEVLFNRLFLNLVEPELPTDRPVFLTGYPSFIQTLAARIPGTPWSRRWELYLSGIELANCYAEENDPERVRLFFERETAEKRKAALVPFHIDTTFAAQTSSLPRCSGTALGVDRLLTIVLQLNSIGEVIYQPL